MNTLLPARLDTRCIPWPGALSPEGYGRLGDEYAHRLAWEEASGEPIPEGLQIDHLCHAASGCKLTGRDCPHRRCTNTDHLEPVTPKENNHRGNSPWAVNWRKTHCVRGHEFTEENTAWRRGVRECVECRTFWRKYGNRLTTAARTHCPAGHEYAPENTQWRKGKGGSLIRRCVMCIEGRTHCKNGHPWNEENTSRATSAGNRRCLVCHRESAARRRIERNA